MIYNTGRLMGPHTTMTWSQLLDIIDDTEKVILGLGLRASGYQAAAKVLQVAQSLFDILLEAAAGR